MDPQRLKDAYLKLQSLDDRLTHRVRPRSGGSLIRPSTEQLEQTVRELASYTIELKEVLDELFHAIASRPRPGEPGETGGPGGTGGPGPDGGGAGTAG